MFLKNDFHSPIVVLWAFITKLRTMARVPTTTKVDSYSIIILSSILAAVTIAHVVQQVIISTINATAQVVVMMGEVATAFRRVWVEMDFKKTVGVKTHEKSYRPSFPGFPTFHPSPLNPYVINIFSGYCTPCNTPKPSGYDAFAGVMSPRSAETTTHNDLVSKLWEANWHMPNSYFTHFPGTDNEATTPPSPDMAFTPTDMSRSTSSVSEAYPVTPIMESEHVLPMVHIKDFGYPLPMKAATYKVCNKGGDFEVRM